MKIAQSPYLKYKKNNYFHYDSKVLSEGSVVVFLNAGHSKAKESSVFVDVIEKGSNVKGVELLQHTAQYSNSLVQVSNTAEMLRDVLYSKYSVTCYTFTLFGLQVIQTQRQSKLDAICWFSINTIRYLCFSDNK